MKQARVFVAVACAASLFGLSSAQAASTTLTGTVRDFVADGVNFEGSGPGPTTGLVESHLTGSAPTLTALGTSLIDAGNFAQWFTKSTDLTTHAITLTETAPGSGIYQFSSNAFFPIDGQLLGNQGNSHNYHFTYALSGTFGYQPGAGQTFSFTGDDDVWVYFDKELGIDLGGIHPAMSASVNLDTLLAGRPLGNYSLDLFFAERHTSESNLQINTSLALQAVPEPETWVLSGLGLLVMGGMSRSRRRQQG